MSMLAEPRCRQKWSDDPRNTRWATDTSKFGYQMLTKMGWSEGKGLGHNENGSVSHIKVKKNRANAGIGSKKSHDDDWISHQNDFNALLNQLNQGTTRNGETKISSLEDRVKMSKKKILYTKFVKSKDLSNASSHDLACIFGQRSKSAPSTPQLSDDDGGQSDCSVASCPTNKEGVKEHGVVTIHSGVSVTDYFAQKMAAIKQSKQENDTTKKGISIQESDQSLEENSISSTGAGEDGKEKRKKRKRYEISDEDSSKDDLGHSKKKKKIKNNSVIDEDNNEEKSKKVKKKKKNKQMEMTDDIQEERLMKKNKKKRKNGSESETEVSSHENLEDNFVEKGNKVVGESILKKKKKKKKNYEKLQNSEIILEDTESSEVPANPCKKKKKKKRKENIAEETVKSTEDCCKEINDKIELPEKKFSKIKKIGYSTAEIPEIMVR